MQDKVFSPLNSEFKHVTSWVHLQGTKLDSAMLKQSVLGQTMVCIAKLPWV